jgi:hypothetical protein
MAEQRDRPWAGQQQGIAGRRRGVSLTGGEPAAAERLAAAQQLPLVLQPEAPGTDLIAWAASRRARILALLLGNGGILFRGFRLGGGPELERFIRVLADDLLDYTYRSTPRTAVGGKIYTSTEYPADQSIPMHNEMSYASSWPRKICFFSMQVAATGGETPLADSRKVLARIAAPICRRFVERGVMYVRNYGGGLDLPWQDVFQTRDRAAVEAYCRRHGIDLEWRGEQQLRTRQVCQATARHPQTAEELWFNQAHLFHSSSLDAALRELLLREVGEQGLPRHAYYGDGSPIEEEALREVRNAYGR